jgi:hypothetical protein
MLAPCFRPAPHDAYERPSRARAANAPATHASPATAPAAPPRPTASPQKVMLTNEPALVAGAAALLEQILAGSDDAMARLYATGAFFFALAYVSRGPSTHRLRAVIRYDLIRYDLI